MVGLDGSRLVDRTGGLEIEVVGPLSNLMLDLTFVGLMGELTMREVTVATMAPTPMEARLPANIS